MAKTATRLFEHHFKAGQEAYVYKLDPPLVYEDYLWSEDKELGGGSLPQATEYVWVSGSNVLFTGPETFMFPCTPEGTVTSWGEIGASQRGCIDPDKIVRETGYEVVEKEEA